MSALPSGIIFPTLDHLTVGAGFPPEARQLRVTSSPLVTSRNWGVDRSTDGGAEMVDDNNMVIIYKMTPGFAATTNYHHKIFVLY